MSIRKLSERQRWTELMRISEPYPNEAGAKTALVRHQELLAVLKAFQKIGRVVRIEPAKYGNGFVIKARRA